MEKIDGVKPWCEKKGVEKSMGGNHFAKDSIMFSPPAASKKNKRIFVLKGSFVHGHQNKNNGSIGRTKLEWSIRMGGLRCHTNSSGLDAAPLVLAMGLEHSHTHSLTSSGGLNATSRSLTSFSGQNTTTHSHSLTLG